MEIKLTTPLTEEKTKNLKAGDSVLLSGVLYTGRDAAHKRLIDLLDEGKELPINIKDEVIYYVGPSPAKPGMVIGSAGPTTSYRMDPYAPRLLDLGLIKGTEVQSISKSPSGNLVAYLIRGAVIALRAEDASKILVERI